MGDRLEGIRSRLEAIAEELGDVAIDRLREAMGDGPDAAAAAVADERTINRARRSVEKAVGLLQVQEKAAPD
ncbi:MAG: hypothetical protein M0020_00300 [Actinomycetota bacterium]|nr:hypothetical protein [Actinomycetota bacterium]